jgi:hypothetical protein
MMILCCENMRAYRPSSFGKPPSPSPLCFAALRTARCTQKGQSHLELWDFKCVWSLEYRDIKCVWSLEYRDIKSAGHENEKYPTTGYIVRLCGNTQFSQQTSDAVTVTGVVQGQIACHFFLRHLLSAHPVLHHHFNFDDCNLGSTREGFFRQNAVPRSGGLVWSDITCPATACQHCAVPGDFHPGRLGGSCLQGGQGCRPLRGPWLHQLRCVSATRSSLPRLPPYWGPPFPFSPRNHTFNNQGVSFVRPYPQSAIPATL